MTCCSCLPSAQIACNKCAGGALASSATHTIRAYPPLHGVEVQIPGLAQAQPQAEDLTAGQHSTGQPLVLVTEASPMGGCPPPSPTSRTPHPAHLLAPTLSLPLTEPQSGHREAAVRVMDLGIAALPESAAEMCRMGHAIQRSAGTPLLPGHPGLLVGVKGTALCAAQVHTTSVSQ